MATKTKGLGTLFQVQISGSYTTVGQRASIDPNETTIEMKDVTDLDSAVVEKRPTIPDPGDLGLQIWWDPNDATHQQLATWAGSPPAAAVPMKLIFPTSPVRTANFSGYISGFKPGGIDPKGYMTADVKVAVTTTIVWT